MLLFWCASKTVQVKRSRSSIWRCIFDTTLHCHNFLIRLVQKQKPQGHEFLTQTSDIFRSSNKNIQLIVV
jgi:hypothetical protein